MASTIYICRLLLLFISIAIATGDSIANIEPASCSENEEWICGPMCIETCDYKPESCVKSCQFGCFCKEGYVRQSNETGSPCIKRENCGGKKCCKNQEYLTCGSACPKTCNDFSYPLPKPPKACIALCKTGCFCKEGYYLKRKNKCVAPEKCCDGENEHYTSCGTACPETCDQKPQMCTKQCVQGCFCKSSDYVRKSNGTNSPCIKRDECPIKTD